MYNIHPTDFLIFSFDREAFQSKVLFQRPPQRVMYFSLCSTTRQILHFVQNDK